MGDICVQVDALLKRHVPGAKLLSRAGGETAYCLPKGNAARCELCAFAI